MKLQKVDSHTERKIATAMVVSKEFLDQGYSIINIELIKAKHLQKIAGWCLKYFEKYKEAPKKNIESIYHSWVKKGKAQEEVVDAVHDILEDLSDQYEEDPSINIPYLLDTTAEYFNTRRIEVLKDELEYSLSQDNGNSASEAIAKFSLVSAKTNYGIDPLNDEDAWNLAFAESQKPLIKWGNKDADYFFGNALTRDGLIGVLAPEKRGKTWWCVEFAMRAVSQRKKVALFEVGDMSQSQILRRLGVRLTRRPMFRKDLGIIEIPKQMKKNGKAVKIRTKKIECKKIVNEIASKKAIKRFLRANGIKPSQPHFMISTHPTSSINIHEITFILEQWENYRNFVPDIIIIDYPDILAPEPGTGSLATRDQINSTWKAMRRLSQEKHCLVIAPTQADAASYTQEILNAGNFSEDKRKLSHVTGMLGLNQTSEEKSKGVMRLNWIVLRESDFNVDRCLFVGQCFTLGSAFNCALL